jgi:hypothetical protein
MMIDVRWKFKYTCVLEQRYTVVIGDELLKQGAQYTIVTQVAMVEIHHKLHKGFYCAK